MRIFDGDEIKGKQFGVRFQRRGGDDDPHICVQILTEDDEIWHDAGTAFSSFWLDDLIRILQQAKITMTSGAVLGEWGFQFKPQPSNKSGGKDA